MEKQELAEKLIEIGITDYQVANLFKSYTLEKLEDYYEVINFKKNILKEKSIHNWAAFFMKHIKENVDISISKRQMRNYFHQQQTKEEQKKLSEQEAIDKKTEHQQYLSDHQKMKAIIDQLSEEEQKNMNTLMDKFIEKEYGTVKYGLDTLRNFELIKVLKKYNWDINIIKKRLK